MTQSSISRIPISRSPTCGGGSLNTSTTLWLDSGNLLPSHQTPRLFPTRLVPSNILRVSHPAEGSGCSKDAASWGVQDASARVDNAAVLLCPGLPLFFPKDFAKRAFAANHVQLSFNAVKGVAP